MAQTGSMVTTKMLGFLTDPASGLNLYVGEISVNAGVNLAMVGAGQISAENVAPEIVEKTAGAVYPALQVYCDKVNNTLKEKFRTFSGKARLVIEARVSQDRLHGIEQQMQLYIDAVTGVLDGNRGDWGQGMFYTGGYEVLYGPVKHGGKNFLQVGKVTLEVDISAN
ncbi:MAG: hypothetical protein ABI165_01795 [Bryobacteraceae bacterium]